MIDYTLLVLALVGMNTVLFIATLIFLKDMKIKIEFIRNSILMQNLRVERKKPSVEEIQEKLMEVMERLKDMEKT